MCWFNFSPHIFKTIKGFLFGFIVFPALGDSPPIQRLCDLDHVPLKTDEKTKDFSHDISQKLKEHLDTLISESFQLDLEQQVQGPENIKIHDITHIHLNESKTQVTATVVFNHTHEPVTISAKLTLMMLVPVANRILMPGTILKESDFILKEFPLRRVTSHIISDVQHVIGRQIKHNPLKPGVPIKSSDIKTIDIVERGKPVMVHLIHPSMSLELQGMALENGAMNDMIRVMNPQSQKIMYARVKGPYYTHVDTTMGLERKK